MISKFIFYVTVLDQSGNAGGSNTNIDLDNLKVNKLSVKEYYLEEHYPDGLDSENPQNSIKVLCIKRAPAANSPSENNIYNIFEVMAPEDDAKESTVTLMRVPDPTRGGAEFVDFFNMGYSDAHLMGMRIQSRGNAKLLPWVMQYNPGNPAGGVYTVSKLNPDGTYEHWVRDIQNKTPNADGSYNASAGAMTLMFRISHDGVFQGNNRLFSQRGWIGRLPGPFASKADALAEGLAVGDTYLHSNGSMLMIQNEDPNDEPAFGGSSSPNPFYYSAVYVTLAPNPTNSMYISYHQDSIMNDRRVLLGMTERDYVSARPIYYKLSGGTAWQIVNPQSSIPLRFTDQTIHHTFLSGLTQDSEYEFCIGNPTEYTDNGFDAPIHKFRTLPSTLTGELKFAVGSDAHGESDLGVSPGTVKVLDFAATHDIRFWVVIGDWCNDEGQPRYAQRWTDFWEAHSGRFKDSEGRLVPILPGIGNHDIAWKWGEQSASALGILNRPYFLDLFPNLNQGEGEYGNVTVGNYLLMLMLNNNYVSYANWSGTDFNVTQLDWAESLLESNSEFTYKIPFYHVSIFNSYDYRRFSDPAMNRDRMVNLFNEYRMKFGFGGHDHNFKVTKEIAYDIQATDDVGTDGNYANFREIEVGEYGFTEVGDGGMGNKIYPPDLASNWYMDLCLNGNLHCNIVTINDANQMRVESYDIPFTGTPTPTKISDKLIDYSTGVRPENNVIPPLENPYDANTTEFIMQIQTATDNETFTIPTNSLAGVYDYSVEWGDTNAYTGQTGDSTHTYTTAGLYDVKISGTFPAIYFNELGDRLKVREIRSWGNIAWASMENAFFGCSNMIMNAKNVPDLTNVTSMMAMFEGCTAFIDTESLIGTWNTANVQIMRDLFRDCSNFNTDISGWNLAGLINGTNDRFWSVLRGASSYNHSLATLNINNIPSMIGTLSGSGLSEANYNDTLIGWLNNSTPQNEVILDANGLIHSGLGTSAREDLVLVHSWDIRNDIDGN